MDINFEESRAIYLQIEDKFRSAIAAGELQPGQKLDSVRELAAAMRVNPTTIQRAFAELERDGLLHTERTIGKFVTKDREKIAELRRREGEKACAEFMHKMALLGYSAEETEDFFAERSGNERRAKLSAG